MNASDVTANITRLQSLLGRFSSDLAKTDAASGGFSKTRQGLESISQQMQFVTRAYAAWMGLQGVVSGMRGLADTADAWTSINARMKLSTRSAEEFGLALEGVYAISQASAAPLAANAQLYSRIAGAIRNMGGDYAQTLGVVQAVSDAMKISGATTEEASSAILQLSQALGSGVLRGEEFNAVNEAAPRLLDAIAQGMGRNKEQLRGLAEQGKLTSDVVVNALLKSMGQLRQEAGSIPLTISGATQQLSNAWARFIGETDQATHTSSLLAGGISALANNLGAVADAAVTTGAALAVVWGGAQVGRVTNLGMAAMVSAAQTRALAVETMAAAAAEAAAAKAEISRLTTMAALTGETTALTAAQGRLAVATEAYAAAQTAANAATTGAVVTGGARTALAGLLSLLGGPVGVVAALGLAAAAWVGFGRESETATDKAGSAVKRLLPELEKLGAAQLRVLEIDQGRVIGGLESQLSIAEARAETVRRQLLEKGQRATGNEDFVRAKAEVEALSQRLRQEQETLRRIRERSETPAPTLRAVAPSIEEAAKGYLDKTRFGIEAERAKDLERINAAYDAEIAKAASNAQKVAQLKQQKSEVLLALERDYASKLVVLEKDGLAVTKQTDQDRVRLAEMTAETRIAAIGRETQTVRASLEAQAAQEEASHRQGLTSLTRYTTRRIELIQQMRDQELAAQDQKLAITSAAPANDPVATLERGNRVAEIEAEKVRIARQAEEEIGRIRADAAERTRQLESDLAAQTRQLRVANTEDNRARAQAAFDTEVEEMYRRVDAEAATLDDRERLLGRFYAWRAQREQQLAREMRGPLAETAANWHDTVGQLESASVRWADSFADHMAEMAMTGKTSFADMANSIIRDLYRIQAQKAMAPAMEAGSDWLQSGMKGALSGIFNGMFPSSTPASSPVAFQGPDGPALSKPAPVGVEEIDFGGYRASGGPVTAGLAYVVGERRPELFVPNSSGSILPYVPEGGGGSAPTIIINNTINASGADEGVIAKIAPLLERNKQDMLRAIPGVVMAQMRKGGQFTSTIRGR